MDTNKTLIFDGALSSTDDICCALSLLGGSTVVTSTTKRCNVDHWIRGEHYNIDLYPQDEITIHHDGAISKNKK